MKLALFGEIKDIVGHRMRIHSKNQLSIIIIIGLRLYGVKLVPGDYKMTSQTCTDFF